jgi:transcriptional regulator with XRE-family HTH domain
VLKKRKETKDDEDALKSRFGAIVRTLRQRLGISQEELAWRAEIHRTYLADIERGKRNISLSSIVKLVRALGVTLTEFFQAFEGGPDDETAASAAQSAPSAKAVRKSHSGRAARR